jgi:hypothetical protein
MWSFDDPDDPWAAAEYLPDDYRLSANGPVAHDPAGGRFGGGLHLPDGNWFKAVGGFNNGQPDCSYLYWGDHKGFNVDRAGAMPPTFPTGNSAYTISAWIKPSSTYGADGGSRTFQAIAGWGAWNRHSHQGEVTVLETINYGIPPLQSQTVRNEWVQPDNAPAGSARKQEFTVVEPGDDFSTFVDTWNHVACTYDGVFLRICYWNGAEVSSVIETAPHNTLAVSRLQV